MIRMCCVMAMVLMVGLVSCSRKEQVYEGMYRGFSTVDETRMTRDPSYDPVQAGEREKQSYQEYKREREQVLTE